MLKFSFILPCYNVEQYIGRCLDSILNQDILHSEYEIICVNDCSPDNLSDVVRKYQQEYPNIIFIEHTENKTAGGARNTGIDYARGEYIWFVDPDDVIGVNSLAMICDYVKKNNLDILLFNYNDADEQLKDITPNKFFADTEDITAGWDFIEKNFSTSFNRLGLVWCRCYNRKFLHDNNIKFPIMRKSQDVVFAWRSLLLAKRVKSISETLYTFRNNPNSVTHVRKNAIVIFSERYQFGLEVDEILNEFTRSLTNNIKKQLYNTCKWCANISYDEIFGLSSEERFKFYQLYKQNNEKIQRLYSYMSRKNKIIFTCGINYHIWCMLIKLFF